MVLGTGGLVQRSLGEVVPLACGLRKDCNLSLRILMNAILNFCCVLSVVCLLSLVAGTVSDSDAPVTDVKSEKTTNRRPSAKPVVFNSHARAKAVQYFDTYRAEPYGLPPACVALMNPIENPAEMAEVEVAVGKVVKDSERARLLEIPSDLARIFPNQPEGFRYCIAGSHLIVVDEGCRVMDLVRIPTIHPASIEALSSPVKLASHRF
jgi:hypothetical protein